MRNQKIKNDLDSLRKIWSESISTWKFENENYIQPIEKLIKISDNKKAEHWMINVAKSNLDLVIEKVGSKSFSEKELRNLYHYIKYLEKTGVEFKEKKYPHLDSANWGEWQKHCKNLNISFNFVLPED